MIIDYTIDTFYILKLAHKLEKLAAQPCILQKDDLSNIKYDFFIALDL